MNNNKPIPIPGRWTLGASLLISSLVLPGTGHGNPHEEPADSPNIILILADDMGYSDLHCYGSEISTPNLDRLADNGLRFTQFYNNARSCPTRASLLTGVYQHQAGIGHMGGGKYGDTDAYQGYLKESVITIADVLNRSGYFTAMTGKWHLGMRDASMKPMAKGFDRYYGFPKGAGNYFGRMFDRPGHILERNGQEILRRGEAYPANWYATFEWAEKGVDFIQEATKQDKPFFLYLAFNAPHWPLQAPDSVMNQYAGRYMKGWKALRKERFQRMKQIGLIDDTYRLPEFDDKVKPWASLTRQQKLKQDSIMAAYAACVDLMDQSIGRMLDYLRETDELENSLIFFLSDNGGCAEGPGNGLGNNVTRNADPAGPIGSAKSFVRCGRGWATAQNTPFRLYKHWTHEGGINTPFIVHWPNGIEDQGAIRNQPGHIIDVMATCVDVAGARYPSTHEGSEIIPYEGVSLLPALNNKKLGRDTLCWEHEGNRAIRIGSWKLVSRTEKRRVFDKQDLDAWELYHMATDPTETHNLAAQYPEKVQAMKQAWFQWAEKKKILPWPWSDNDFVRSELR